MTLIIQHCFGKSESGGPVMAMERLIKNSPIPFGQLRQIDAAGGLDLGLLLRFTKELRKTQPKLIHVRGLGNEGFHAALAAWLAGVPNILVSIHGTHRDLLFPSSLLRHWVVTQLLEPLTLVMATHIATVCDYASNRPFLENYRKKLVAVVPNGVYLPAEASSQGLQVREEYAIPALLPLAVTVSRITKEKGYLTLAAALRLLDLSGPKFAILIVGGGDELGEIRSEFSGLQNITVHFVGHQSNVARFLAEADFFVFPTLHENLSNALLEAMSHGLPIVATETGGNTEVLRRGGGLLVPPEHPEELASAIKRLSEDAKLRRKLGEESAQVVSNFYSVERMVKSWLCVYGNILGRRLDAD